MEGWRVSNCTEPFRALDEVRRRQRDRAVEGLRRIYRLCRAKNLDDAEVRKQVAEHAERVLASGVQRDPEAL
jgi:hypothetical protein